RPDSRGAGPALARWLPKRMRTVISTQPDTRASDSRSESRRWARRSAEAASVASTWPKRAGTGVARDIASRTTLSCARARATLGATIISGVSLTHAASPCADSSRTGASSTPRRDASGGSQPAGMMQYRYVGIGRRALLRGRVIELGLDGGDVDA